MEGENLSRGGGTGPASIFSLKEKYAIETAPWLEEGIFTLALFGILSSLLVVGVLTLYGFLIGMGISYAIFIGAHVINISRAPPNMFGFYKKLRWAFKAPIKVGLFNFGISAAVAKILLMTSPAGATFFAALPFICMFTFFSYFSGYLVHSLANLNARIKGDHAPAALAGMDPGNPDFDFEKWVCDIFIPELFAISKKHGEEGVTEDYACKWIDRIVRPVEPDFDMEGLASSGVTTMMNSLKMNSLIRTTSLAVLTSILFSACTTIPEQLKGDYSALTPGNTTEITL